MQYISYFILVFGVAGIALGLYGLVVPMLRQRGFSIHLPRLRLPSLPKRARSGNELAAVDSLIAELEQAGFRGSPFEAKGPIAVAPAAAIPAMRRVETQPPSVLPELDLDEPDEELEALLEKPLLVPEPAQVPAVAAAAEPYTAGEESFALDQPETEPVAAAAADPLAGGDDLLSFFEESTSESTTPAVLLEAIEEIDIHDLLAEARELRSMLGGSNR